MYGAQPLTPRRKRGGSSAGLSLVLALVAVGGGIYFVLQRADRRPRPPEDPIAQIAALARVEKDSEYLQRATREKRAILGMTAREVELAKGAPTDRARGDALTAAQRAQGAVEAWTYTLPDGQESTVLFGGNGLVIRSTDVSDKPARGDFIRN